jgi:transposase InsO family protein
MGVKALFESFNGKLRDECLNAELIYTLHEAHNIIERWRRDYNTIRLQSSLGFGRRRQKPPRRPVPVFCYIKSRP